jgi:hypothetical protein
MRTETNYGGSLLGGRTPLCHYRYIRNGRVISN